MKNLKNLQKRLVLAFGAAGIALGSSVSFAAADYTALTDAITGEQAAIIAVIIAVAGVLAAVYAVKRGAGIGLSAIKGR
jgi:hypothetical protein